MPTENIQIIRLEVSQTGVTEGGRSNPSVVSPGTLVAAGDVGNKLNRKLEQQMNPTVNSSTNWRDHYDENIAKKVSDYRGSQSRPPLEPDFDPDYTPGSVPKPTLKQDKKQTKINDKSSPVTKNKFNSKSVMKLGKKSVVTASAAYAMYSQHQSIGYSLSGASHAAERQQRNAQGATFATGLALSAATGQYWATALMLAGKAWQLAQTNRQEMFKIRSSQIISSVMKERLVKNTIERRF